MNKTLKALLLIVASLVLVACGNNESAENSDASVGEVTKVKIGVVGDVSREIWEDVSTRLKDQNIDLEVVGFNDYPQVNMALADGSLDMNAFQHVAYLREHVLSSGDDIVPIGYSIMSPVYLYAVDEIPDVESIPEGVKVALTNSPTVAERAFLALQAIGLIELDENVGFAPTQDDIVNNIKNIEIHEMEASQVARVLGDVEIVVLGGDMLADAGYDPEDAIYVDTDNIDSIDPLKKNIIAVRGEDVDNPIYQAIKDEYQTEATANKIKEISQGSSLPIWEEGEDPISDFKKALEED